MAGGKTDIEDCPPIEALMDLSAGGTYIDRPDFVVSIDQPMRLILESEGQCDTTLVVLDGSGNWHYSDDGAPDLNGGQVTLYEDTEGPHKVWIGTYGPELCEGALVLKRGLFKE